MTNNWTDIGNSTCVVIMGANPAENHPACMAHVNNARAKGAKLIVIDPRLTRTAKQIDPSKGDFHVRIRPGTDIAFINGVMRYMIDRMETSGSTYASGSVIPQSVKDNFYAFLNRKDAGLFYADDGATATVSVPNQSKYTDATFILKADGTDYERETIVAATGATAIGGEPANTVISNFPKKAANVLADANTVYNRLKAHLAPYTDAAVTDICGCQSGEVALVGDAFLQNSRAASSTGASFGANTQDPTAAGYKAVTMLYAMGLTQHSYGSQNCKSFATIQTFMGNMGRAGGGVNALRGIHNVQGSTDMGLLYGNIPAYSSNPSTQPSVDANAFGKYMDALWGNPLSGTANRATMNGSYDDAYNITSMALQQRGFFNMTLKWFGDYAAVTALADPVAKRAAVNATYALWPKGAGDDHITMFRHMADGTTKAAVVWGQNPAVTEPNQSKVREGLENLDMLVCVDLFENETAAASRKAGGVTYLLPACSHVEEAGSVTNSGRTLQWRERATTPRGNSKADLELLLRLAYQLDVAGAFSHISTAWVNDLGYTNPGGQWVYSKLYGTPYGWTPGTAFDSASLANVYMWHAGASAPVQETVYGSEAVTENIFREMCTPSASGGTIWIYTGAYNAGGTWAADNKGGSQAPWQTQNKAKSRDNANDANNLQFHGWGYAWLVNRRVLYNNTEIPGDVADYFMGPDSAGRLFVSTKAGVLNYSRWYRTVHQLTDRPDTYAAPGTPHVLPGRFPAHTEPLETPRTDLAAKWGRNTSNGAALLKVDSLAAAGRVGDANPANFPLVLTTIRCVEHFQGGPITRNNPWNVEAEPEPWVEINSLDATKYGIKDGDLVNVITPRSNSTTDQQTRTNGAAGFAKGFRARVGVGVQGNQRVPSGIVAIPWHWGDRGLSTGSRANDLCIDAWDANSKIPESKACLCKIQKL